MTRQNTETEILQQALNAFQQTTGIHLEYFQDNHLPLEMHLDGRIRLTGNFNTDDLNVEVKATINEVILGRLAQHVRTNPENYILVTRYAPPYLAKKMKELHIQFIDTAGNAFLNRPPVLVYVYGNKAAERHAEPTIEGLFGVGGIRIIFSLLCEPNLVNATYRDIATAAGVALGTVAGVMKDLTEQQYLVELTGRGRTLMKKKELAEKWTDAYTTKLRRKRFIGRYAAPREQFWRDIQIDPIKALWGGEVAAYKLIQYLKPEVITLYTRKPVDDLVVALKLRKDEKGPIELREKFWQFDYPDNRNVVPPLLVYADLIAVGDPRTIEAATMIHDEYLKRHFQ